MQETKKELHAMYFIFNLFLFFRDISGTEAIGKHLMISSTYQVASNATGIAGTLIFSFLILTESLLSCCTSKFNSDMFSPRILLSRLFM